MLDQIFNNEICLCNHSILEEHSSGRCYALDLIGGLVWKACDCRKVRIKPFSIRVERNESIPTNTNQEERRIKSTESPISAAKSAVTAKSKFVWGQKA